jgi:hypothetical protein
VELAITGTELELLQEQRVIVQSERVEDVKVSLRACISRACFNMLQKEKTYLLGQNKSIVHQHQQPLLQTFLLLRERGV